MAGHVEQEILAQEARLTLATRQLDLEALDRIYAEEILFTGLTGATCDKASLMDEARRGQAERRAASETRHFVASYDKEDIRVVAHGDTAVASWRFVVTIQHDGEESRRAYRTTNVWLRRQSGWQVIAGHTSNIAVPA